MGFRLVSGLELGLGVFRVRVRVGDGLKRGALPNHRVIERVCLQESARGMCCHGTGAIKVGFRVLVGIRGLWLGLGLV